MTSTQLKVIATAMLAALGVYLWARYILPLGARAIPAITLIGWLYVITRPISKTWRELGPSPPIVLGTLAVQAFVALWLMVAIAFAVRAVVTGQSLIPENGDTLATTFFWLTAPFWWAFACAFAMLFKRSAGTP